MKSYPSTLNESMAQYGGHTFTKYSKSFDIERLNTINLNTSTPVVQEMLKEQNINIANFQQYQSHVEGNIETYTENPNTLPFDILNLMKDYEWQYEKPAVVLRSYIKEKDEKVQQAVISKQPVSPSMFNPMYGVNTLGLTSNVPLLNGLDYSEEDKGGYLSFKKNLSVCTIRELCTLSNNPDSILGMAKYKYADFMYCKDLGKVSNNYLITLRRFAHPVGDHIFELSNPKFNNPDEPSYLQAGDIGRLVTWFGTDDNKLEDIIKFSYHTTWKELGSQIEEKNSTADDSTTGLLGMVSNTLFPAYQQSIQNGTAGQHSIWTYLGGKLGIESLMTQGIGKNNELLTNYDKNKVYTPKNTIQATHIYEGKIEFTHEFTLNFSYKLRAYDNINPKSAFLDLLGNILEVTGRRGAFWGGRRKLIGPQTNLAMFDQVEKIIDNKFDQLGGMWDQFISNGVSMDAIMGCIGAIGQKFQQAVQSIQNFDPENLKQAGKDIGEAISKTDPIGAAKGYLKNALGRPTKIAWQSLLTGDDVGLWHVTIGNPKNPIMVMGNLIVTDSNIQQSGVLGVDDFPTELKVSITLKHARPRDITDISKMYTKGLSTLYYPLMYGKIDNYFDSAAGFDSGSMDKPSAAIKSDIKAVKNEVADSPHITTDYALKIAQMNNYSAVMAALSGNEAL